MSRNILLRIAYDGTEFNGYQLQAKGERTVQGVLEAALSEMHGREVRVHAAGRTDSGVHADAQYVNFRSDLDTVPPEKFVLALNRYLPPDLKGQESREVPEGFHARFSAKRRSYRYYVLVAPMPVPKYRNYAYRISRMPDLAALNRDASALLGEHDFTTFAAAGEGTESKVREVYEARFTWEPPFVVFSITANGFLWKQVRSTVGTILGRDRDRRDGVAGTPGGVKLPTVEELLTARDRSLAGPTAPPQGLFLTDVTYDV
ncbi:MAG: tRNA pseudouridine(38-40) synthase TruA [Spirochaetaceae bacterium]